MSFKWYIPALMAARKGTAPLDTDAQAFISAAGISNATQIEAINNAFVYGKSVGLLDSSNILNSKIKAMYMWVGGTSASCKLNAINPVDSDVAFRLTFTPGWIFASTGGTPNGTTDYADTHLIPSSALTQDSTHLSFCSRTNESTDAYDMGSSDGGSFFAIGARRFGDNYQGYQYGNSFAITNYSNTDSTGYYIDTRTASTTQVAYKAGLVQDTDSTSSQSINGTYSVWIGGLNNIGSLFKPSSKERTFDTIGLGLTATDAANLNTLVTNFNTTLGR